MAELVVNSAVRLTPPPRSRRASTQMKLKLLHENRPVSIVETLREVASLASLCTCTGAEALCTYQTCICP